MTTRASQDTGSGPLPVITPHGEFDYQSVPPLWTQIDAALAVHGGVILDATGITFTDSTFLTMLLATHQHSRLRMVPPPGSPASSASTASTKSSTSTQPSTPPAPHELPRTPQPTEPRRQHARRRDRRRTGKAPARRPTRPSCSRTLTSPPDQATVR
ncbi:STAS domain-containing protein [Streptomyces griseus]|uniref:STAS domain-containing protein n=1 Tax=Streptomyces griseus TaxID=1911 RepID=UPI0037FAD20D